VAGFSYVPIFALHGFHLIEGDSRCYHISVSPQLTGKPFNSATLFTSAVALAVALLRLAVLMRMHHGLTIQIPEMKESASDAYLPVCFPGVAKWHKLAIMAYYTSISKPSQQGCHHV